MTALDTGISINMFYGDPGQDAFISKMFRPPYREHFHYWFLNIVQQNREHQSWPKILARLPEVIRHFFIKLWHEVPRDSQVEELVELVLQHCGLSSLPPALPDQGRFPPVLKIRGLLHRDGGKKTAR